MEYHKVTTDLIDTKTQKKVLPNTTEKEREYDTKFDALRVLNEVTDFSWKNGLAS